MGALGIPVNPTLQKWLDFPAFVRVRQLKWIDTALTDNVLNAFHALALDEHRSPFSPAVWEKPEGCMTNLKQVWFPGVHSGVGGGYEDTATADISLAWMMDQLSGNSTGQARYEDAEKWIEFKDDYLVRLQNMNREWYKNHKLPPKTWGSGAIFRSLNFPQSLAGRINRTPGRYRVLDSATGKALEGNLLRDTNELIHASVRARIDLGGHGPVDSPNQWALWTRLVGLLHRIMGRTGARFYRPAALQGWTLKDGHDHHDDLAVNNRLLLSRDAAVPTWTWQGEDAQVKKGICLYEDGMGRFELQLLRRYEQVCDDIEASNQGLESIEALRIRQRQTKERETRRSVTV